MPDKEFLDNLLSAWQKAVAYTSTMSKEDLIDNAIRYIKDKNNYEKIKRAFFVNKDEKKEAIFMSGMSGAGKSEFVSALNFANNLNIIAPDDVRQFLPGYTGTNAHFFQKATSICVSKLFSDAINDRVPFVMDTNLANIDIARQNIERLLKRDYSIVLYFINRMPSDALKTAVNRENSEGRHVPIEVFISKGIGAIDTFQKILLEYGERENIDVFIVDPERIIELEKKNALEIFKAETKNAYDELKKMQTDLGSISLFGENKENRNIQFEKSTGKQALL